MPHRAELVVIQGGTSSKGQKSVPHGAELVPHWAELVPHGAELVPHRAELVPHRAELVLFLLTKERNTIEKKKKKNRRWR
jgi:hypothetical protein